jgi:hypothetical protein
MVDCYLGLGRQREAANVATGACKQMANSPQALTLYASVLLKVRNSRISELPHMGCQPSIAYTVNLEHFVVISE